MRFCGLPLRVCNLERGQRKPDEAPQRIRGRAICRHLLRRRAETPFPLGPAHRWLNLQRCSAIPSKACIVTSLDRIVKTLGAERVGSCYMALCPAHDDRNPSLSISQRDGKVLLHCHAGCSQRKVVAALKERGLWESEATRETRRIVAEYNYSDEQGQLPYQVVRYEPKDFRPRYPDARGGWIFKKHPRQVLYRLPEVQESPIVFLVEGEKDVEALR